MTITLFELQNVNHIFGSFARFDAKTHIGQRLERAKVIVLWRSPAYFDYHWVLNPNVAKDFGADMPEKIIQALLKLNPDVPEQKAILDLFGANKFITTENSNYDEIEAIGREIGKIK